MTRRLLVRCGKPRPVPCPMACRGAYAIRALP